MSRPRTPTNVLEMRGAFVKNPHRKAGRADEPKESRALGEPPAGLNVEQIAVWRELAEMGSWLTYADRAMLELATRLLHTLRMLGFAAPAGVYGQLNQALSKLGLCPTERSKVKVPGGAKEDNPFAEF